MRIIKEEIETFPLLEKLSEQAHIIWSEHVTSLVSRYETEEGNAIIPKEKIESWKKLIMTPYNDLSDEEKDKDREIALKYFNIIKISPDLKEGFLSSLIFKKGVEVKTQRDKFAKIVSDIFKNTNNIDSVIIQYDDGTNDRVSVNSLQLI